MVIAFVLGAVAAFMSKDWRKGVSVGIIVGIIYGIISIILSLIGITMLLGFTTYGLFSGLGMGIIGFFIIIIAEVVSGTIGGILGWLVSKFVKI